MSYLVVVAQGIAKVGAGAGAHTGTAAMKSVVAIAAGEMRIGITTMQAGASDIGVIALAVGKDGVEVEVLVQGETVVRLEKAVRRDEP